MKQLKLLSVVSLLFLFSVQVNANEEPYLNHFLEMKEMYDLALAYHNGEINLTKEELLVLRGKVLTNIQEGMELIKQSMSEEINPYFNETIDILLDIETTLTKAKNLMQSDGECQVFMSIFTFGWTTMMFAVVLCNTIVLLPIGIPLFIVSTIIMEFAMLGLKMFSCPPYL